ncbi:MAG: CoA transferase [Ilumatobacteraceae bacterium]
MTAAGAAPSPPLAGIRVVEHGGSLGAAYAGRLLADLGADVVKVEAPAGDALRHVGPYLDGRAGPERSATAAYFHGGKRSVLADPDTAGGRSTVAALLKAADVVIRSGDVEPDLDEDVLARAEAANPGLVVADISTFGRTGPRAGHRGGDLVALAGSGMLSVVSSDPKVGPPVPIRLRGELSSVFAACHAVVATLGALHARLADGWGQRLDVSALEAMVATMATAVPIVTYSGLVPVAGGTRGVCPWAIYECRDGSFLVQCTEDGQWKALVGMIGDPEWGHLEIFQTTAGRIEQADVVEALVAEAVAGFTVEEFLARAHAAGVPASRVHSPEQVLAWEQLTTRRFFESIRLDDGEVLAPTTPVRLHGRDVGPARSSPRLGEHTADVLAGWEPRPRPTSPAPVVPSRAPLDGVRVIDMTWVWAGPFSVMQLAQLGAEVIKVESTSRVDVTRRLGPFVDEVPGLDRSGYFNSYNQGKRSICLDPTTTEGRDLLGRLLAASDVVVDNMRAGALDRMGFDDDRLRRLNPAIVAVSMTGFGESGPERDRLAYGSLIDALAGVTAVTGPVGGGPTEVPMSLPDPCAGLHAAIGTLGALYRARTTGLGGDLECSMLEAWIAAMPWGVLGVSAEGRAPRPAGTRDDTACPHGAFPCAGEYAWVAICVGGDDEFAALARTIGRPELVADGQFATVAERRRHEDELEAIVAAWTAEQDPATAAALLRSAGVTAEPVRTMDEVVACRHLQERGFFTTHVHPEAGDRALAGPPWHASRSPMRAATPAPLLGQHTQLVMSEVLGLDAATIADLTARGILA